jgi:diguanylate cyclase (GGDEF)-like protein
MLLRTAAEILSVCVDDKGLAARIGGDEFGVLLANADSTACEAMLARIEDVVERRAPLDGFTLSFSLGAASSPPELTLAAAIERADRRMYDRKRQTRPARREPGPGPAVDLFAPRITPGRVIRQPPPGG